MEKRAPRFRCLPDEEGTWTVWDDLTGAPAILGGSALKGRSEERARVACGILKRIYRNRLDAHSMKTSGKARTTPAAR